ncbi:MAG: hypothetical protein R2749_08385 [Acidimicrobiales bacterium]
MPSAPMPRNVSRSAPALKYRGTALASTMTRTSSSAAKRSRASLTWRTIVHSKALTGGRSKDSQPTWSTTRVRTKSLDGASLMTAT